MKAKSKGYFVLGILATLGSLTLVYNCMREADKTPKQLMDDSKKFIQRTVKRGDDLVDQAIDSVETEAKAMMNEASKIV